jgi:hypothetical protein
MISASAGRGAPSHSPSPPATAASFAAPKRARISSSKAVDLVNQTARAVPCAGVPGRPNQKSRTSSGAIVAVMPPLLP